MELQTRPVVKLITHLKMRKNNSDIKFRPTYTAVVQCVSMVLLSAVPFTLVFVTKVNLNTVILILAAIPSCLIAYWGIAKIFTKRIVSDNNGFVFYNGPFRYNIDIEKMQVYYEKVWVLGGNYKDYFGLVLYRDKDKIVGFSMSNRFVLTYEMDEVKLEYYQQEFMSKIGIDIRVVKPLF